jgi:hypothetical protein
MSNAAPNHIKYLLATKAINFAADTFKIILMQSGFVFNKDDHEEYSDVVGNELGTGNGYTQGTKALAGVAVTEDDVDDRCEVVWSNVTWTATGGAIGPASGAIIYDDTVANDPIVGYIDFLSDYTQPDGGTVTIIAPEIRLS